MTKRTILLIEDEEAISEPLAAALAREGFDTVVAGTVEAGLELFDTRTPDLVLVDVMLPDGDGRDILRRIRETSRTPVGNVVENRKITEWPLVGRRFLEFALLGAGVNQGKPGDVRSAHNSQATVAT